MRTEERKLIERLEATHTLSLEEYEAVVAGLTEADVPWLSARADRVRREVYGNAIYIRGLIETGNICRNDCYYCGIRRGNRDCARYALTREQILACCEKGYREGFRTFVLQSGEGCAEIGAVCETVREIKRRYPDCAVTLSLGEMETADYQALFDAGGDRYLLRHETADPAHYRRLHPEPLSLENRLRCLRDLKRIGFQVGCGFMVGSPYQTPHTLAEDLKFIENFRPEMCGIGPFIPHAQTPFAQRPAGSAWLTCCLLAILRLMLPDLLLPSTTALGTIDPRGREMGILAGANVVMPNLSPQDARQKYTLYDGKLAVGAEAVEGLAALRTRMAAIGYEIVTDRGDSKRV